MSAAPAGQALPQPSVLHVNDAAFTASRMVAEARRRDWDWHLLPKAAAAQDWSGPIGKARRALVGGTWVARLRVQAARHDVVHVHSATTLAHSRLGAPRYVLHCHGSDVRVAQYQPDRAEGIRSGLRDAEAVFYATPDLAEHVLPHRPDAVYLPLPVDVGNVPTWDPLPGPPQVVFASRWSPEKNSDAMLAVATALAKALGDKAELVGVDWGPQAPAAAAAGVRLVPKVDHDAYLDLLRHAHVVVGQGTGLLGVSEVEAIATGAPFVFPTAFPHYPQTSPLLGGGVAEAVHVVTALLDGSQPHDPAASRQWAQREHGVRQAVDAVAAVHRDVVAAR